jgi:membrane dipeptidase
MEESAPWVRSPLHMPLLIDAHCDLAWNTLNWGRDYTRSAAETRQRETGSIAVESNGDTLLGWPDYQRGQVALVFSTLFAAPKRTKEGAWDKLCYSSADEAHQLCMDQLNLYHELTESQPDQFRLIGNSQDLQDHMAAWHNPTQQSKPVGLVVLMEGAEGIRTAEELEEWHERGLRLIGLAWSGTRYAGGTREPGPLTEEGRRLLKAMAEFGFVLDLSHMDEQAAWDALEVYDGSIVATHVNCLALLPNFPTNRHYPDLLLRAIIERGGLIGNVPVNSFLKTGWSRKSGSSREEVPLDDFVAHLDHVCQLAGDSRHAGIGSDFDGGFGVQSVPPEIDTIADLQKIGPLLAGRGYTESDVANVLGQNWLRLLQDNLPS